MKVRMIITYDGDTGNCQIAGDEPVADEIIARGLIDKARATLDALSVQERPDGQPERGKGVTVYTAAQMQSLLRGFGG